MLDSSGPTVVRALRVWRSGRAARQPAGSQNLSFLATSRISHAAKLVEALAALGVRTSKISELALPLPKAYRGLVEGFAPETGART